MKLTIVEDKGVADGEFLGVSPLLKLAGGDVRVAPAQAAADNDAPRAGLGAWRLVDGLGRLGLLRGAGLLGLRRLGLGGLGLGRLFLDGGGLFLDGGGLFLDGGRLL